MDISRKLQERLKGVLRVFLGSFKGVSRVSHESFMGEEVSWMFQAFFKEVSRKRSRCLKKVSCCMALIAASRAEGGLVTG